MKGIDISEYQARLNISTLKSKGIDFLIIRLSYGMTHPDPCLDQFYNAAVAAGIPLGAYFYSLATSPENAVRDAKRALELANGRAFPLGIYMDVETSEQLALRDSYLTEICKAFCDTIRDGGYRPGAYGSGLNLWGKVGPSYLGDDVLVWEAAYGRSKPFHPCDIWQDSDKGRINGYNGDVDTDLCMSERFAALINGEAKDTQEPPPSPAPAPAPTDDYIKIKMPVVKYGDKGNAVKLMQTLLIMKGCSCGWTGADGDFGPKTEGALVMFKSKNGLTGETCDPQTWAALLEV